MAVRYGLPPDVISTYQDSYHGWAIKRGRPAVAVCEDCHNAHNIGSALDPASSIHKSNVVRTCARCHPNANVKFAASYTHVLARGRRMVHDWIRIVYIWLIVVVLGAMGLHNFVIMARELREHLRRHRSRPAVERMNGNEVIQHSVLTVAFVILAVTGFALRFPDSWWVRILTDAGMTEKVRQFTHRACAVVLMGAALYHLLYLAFTERGRMLRRARLPRLCDVSEALANVAYYVGFRKERVAFARYDYTQKAEYWALIWGTGIMSLTGLVLWFPTLATSWLPAWVVRACEVVHFYEAILAAAAVVIWHFFFVIFLPRAYPMSWVWITGRMEKEEWEQQHGREADETGRMPRLLPGEQAGPGGDSADA